MPVVAASKGKVAEIRPTEEEEARIKQITANDFFAASLDDEAFVEELSESGSNLRECESETEATA